MKLSTNNLRELLKNFNRWWENKDWDKVDNELGEFDNSELKERPRLFFHLTNNFVSGSYGIVTVRGPRRVGKTTLIKLIIRHLIKERQINPSNIFYIPLDYEQFKVDNISLINLLEAIAESNNEEKYVFLDEVSMYRGWAQALKNAYDEGLIKNYKVRIIATGSHSMDLAEAASKLSDRQGEMAKMINLGGNLVMRPLRFSEVVKAIRKDINEFIANKKFRRPGYRFGILNSLRSGSIDDILRKFYDSYFVFLRESFENYLLHGGYPKAIDEYLKEGRISKNFYNNIADLLIKDSKVAGLDPTNLERLLEYLTGPMTVSNLMNPINLEVIGEDESGKPKRKINWKDYFNYLITTYSFFFGYRESEECKPNYEDMVKNYVLDPFLYHSIRSYFHNSDDPFEESRKMLKDNTFKGLLVESVVASHLLQSQYLFEHVTHVEYDKVLMYRKDDQGEIDFILCITKNNSKYKFYIESKYSSNPKTGKYSINDTVIVLTKDKLDKENNVVYIPVSIFLLLF